MFSDLTKALDDTCLSIFGEPAVFNPQTGEGPITITAITAPAPDEDVLIGTAPGTVVAYLFVRYTEITPNPRRGDVVIYGTPGASYDVVDVLVDRQGGAVLKLRRNA